MGKLKDRYEEFNYTINITDRILPEKNGKVRSVMSNIADAP
jgi:hypothetical protein